MMTCSGLLWLQRGGDVFLHRTVLLSPPLAHSLYGPSLAPHSSKTPNRTTTTTATVIPTRALSHDVLQSHSLSVCCLAIDPHASTSTTTITRFLSRGPRTHQTATTTIFVIPGRSLSRHCSPNTPHTTGVPTVIPTRALSHSCHAPHSKSSPNTTTIIVIPARFLSHGSRIPPTTTTPTIIITPTRALPHKGPTTFPFVIPTRSLSQGGRMSPSLRESYRVLQLPPEGGSSQAEVREAYLSMAKLYHPDSGAPTADAALFARIEEAYRAVLAHLARQKSASQYSSGGGAEDDDDEDKSKLSAFQHRQYMSYEGVGYGTPSQRERQYRQYRMDRATEQVLGYRQREMERTAADAEGAMVERDMRNRSRKIKITQAVERLVEDLIQESMARGDFQNLSGSGKPLSKYQHNPYADPMTHNLNRILIDNGYQPEWIVTQKEIRDTLVKLREGLLAARARLGDPMRPHEEERWQEHCEAFSQELAKLNKRVDTFNLIVPLLKQQVVHYSVRREVERALREDREQREERRRREKELRQKEREMAAQGRGNSRHGGLIAWMQNLLK
ncbi:dnaJ homolog subfamily C member 28 [Engraulis encrasicolus]|uniref:dnaJ homolog subfamily C member 28 n=1 Tax=Engraulis encrasicolus TaxID=184585 RepID=UPI002FCF7D05